MQSTSQTPTAGNPIVDPDTQVFLDVQAAKGGPQIYELSVEDARGVFVAAQGDGALLHAFAKQPDGESICQQSAE